MRIALTLARCCQRLAPDFGLHLFTRDTWLLVEQLQLQGAQRFAFVTVSLDSFQSQLFGERLNLQASPLQFLFQHRNVLLEIGAVHGKSNYKKKTRPVQSISLHF
jgi:hypothetical protein